MLLLVAWDGACWPLLDPMLEQGRLPALAALLKRGARRDLRSTLPAATFPAWTTFMTGAPPAEHGVTDFSVREGYQIRFTNSTFRRLPTLWRLLSDAGRRVGVYGLPATYPPEELKGIQICGFDTPLGAGSSRRVSHPPSLARSLHERYGSLAIGGPQQVRMDEGWHRRELARMLSTIELRTRIACDLVKEGDFDVFMVHYGESDTVAHQFWQFFDPRSPRYLPGGAAEALPAVYSALDRALARLTAELDPSDTVILMSDHGSGGCSDRVVFWNTWLARGGWLGFSGGFHRRRAAVARGLKRAALWALPPATQPRLFSRLSRAAGHLEAGVRLGGIDWSRTKAFSEELNYFPAVWLNIKGREPMGTIEPEAAVEVGNDVAEHLLALRDPFDGGQVVEKVHRREELFSGPFLDRIPDLLLTLRQPGGYSYAGACSRGGSERSAVRRLSVSEMSGERGTVMAGAHRALGMYLAAGPGIAKGRYGRASLAELASVVLHTLEVTPGSWMRSRDWPELGPEGRRRPAGGKPPALGQPQVERHLSPQENEALAHKLRALGYLA